MVPKQSMPMTAAGSTVFYTLRFKIRKDGNLQYISHLDFVRTMQKALVRAGLPLWYSQGFNPIPKLTFAAPLSIGTESDCELMDTRTTYPYDPETAKNQLKAVLPPHLEVLECYVPTVKLSEVGYLAYDIRIAYDGACAAHAEEGARLLAADHITIVRKTKQKTEKEVDLKPMVASATLEFDEKTGELFGKWILSASPTAFLNPEYVLQALREQTNILPAEQIGWYSIRRTAFLNQKLNLFR